MGLEIPSSTAILNESLAGRTSSKTEPVTKEVAAPFSTLAGKGTDSAGIFFAKTTSQSVEEVADYIRTELKTSSHNPKTLDYFEQVYSDTKFDDALFPLIAQFINTPGIDSMIKKLSEEKGDTVSGTAGELYHASILVERGYRIVSFGFSLDTGTKKNGDGLETDLIAQKDDKYYMVEVKHFPGRRWFDKDREDKFVPPKQWAEKFLLNVKDGESNKMQNYGTALRLICSKDPLPSIQEQVGPELEQLREYLRKNGPTILYSYATTAALSITKDGKRIIVDETNQIKDISESDLNIQNDRAELDEIERTVSDCAESYTFYTQFERVPFRLFNKTTRSIGGDKITANRKIESAQPQVIDESLKSEFTQAKLDDVIAKLAELQASSLQLVSEALTKAVGQSHDSKSLLEVIKPLGPQLKKDMQLVKKVIAS